MPLGLLLMLLAHSGPQTGNGDSLDDFVDLILVGDDGHHFLFHLLVNFMISLPDDYVTGVFLDQSKYLLEDEIVNCIVSDFFSLISIFDTVDGFDLL